jgi:aspartate kinase
MIVMKFGGTSVEDAPSIERVSEIIRARLALSPVVVVSAMGKTTRRLLQAAEASAAGDGRTTLGIVADLKTRHLSEARRLLTSSTNAKSEAGDETFVLIDRYFDELKKLLEGLAILGDVPPRGLDKILSYGELLSSAILAGALGCLGIPARLVDSRIFIKTDDRYGSARPLFDLTYSAVRDAMLPLLDGGVVPVAQGYIGSTSEGATTTLGFEGSDYTAALVGAALQAADIQIWKDVSGLMTADPAVCSAARTVEFCSYTEAAELTHFGAKVLHPTAIYPAAEHNIPVHIYNSKKPSDSGTTIAAVGGRGGNTVKSIAYKKAVSVIKIASNFEAARGGPFHEEELLRSVTRELRRRHVAPVITTATGSSLAVVVESASFAGQTQRYLVDEISRLGPVETEEGQAIISLVGESLPDSRNLASLVFNSIADLKIGMIHYGSSPITINFLVAESDADTVVVRLHELLFDKSAPMVFK